METTSFALVADKRLVGTATEVNGQIVSINLLDSTLANRIIGWATSNNLIQIDRNITVL